MIILLKNAVGDWDILVSLKCLCRENLLGINPVLSMKRKFPKVKFIKAQSLKTRILIKCYMNIFIL